MSVFLFTSYFLRSFSILLPKMLLINFRPFTVARMPSKAVSEI